MLAVLSETSAVHRGLDLTCRELRAQLDAGRLADRPRVAERVEATDGLSRSLECLDGPAAPERDVAEQHLEEPGDVAVAARLRLGHLLDRELLRLVESALHEAHPGEERGRERAPTPVAEVVERRAGLLEVLVGLLRAAAEERDRRQVLQRPRLAAPVAEAAVHLERLTAVGVGAVHLAGEHRRAAAGPQRSREAVLVADAPPQLECVVDRAERSGVVALHLLDLGEMRHGAGAVARLRRRLLEDLLEVDGGRREVAVLGVRLRSAELDPPAVLVVEVGREQPDALVVEPHRAAPQLGGGRAARGDLEHLERPLAEVVGDPLDRPELGDELRDGAVVVRGALGVRTVGSAGVLTEPLGERRVPSRPLGLREGAVRDGANDLRREAELSVVERDELSPVERDERILDVDHVAAPVDERPHRFDAARGADDGAVLEHRALDRTERVEPGRDEPAQRRRQLAGLQRRLGRLGTALSQQRGELLDEERVAARALAQERDQLRIDVGPEELARRARRPRPRRAGRG